MAPGEDIPCLTGSSGCETDTPGAEENISFRRVFVQPEANTPPKEERGKKRGGLRQVTAMLFQEDSAPPAAENPGNTPMTCDHDIASTYCPANYHPTQ
jgi:hypothetical protein